MTKLGIFLNVENDVIYELLVLDFQWFDCFREKSAHMFGHS